MSSFERLDGWPGRGRFVPTEEGGRPTGFEPHRATEAPAASSAAPDPREVRRAYEEGLAAGRAEAPSLDLDSLRTATDALGAAAQELTGLRDGTLASQRREALKLGVAIAETILRHSLGADARGLASRIELALGRLADRGPLRLWLAPCDLEVLRSRVEPDLNRVADQAPIELDADAELAAGEFRLQAGPAEVDARLEEMLRSVREELADAAVEEDSP